MTKMNMERGYSDTMTEIIREVRNAGRGKDLTSPLELYVDQRVLLQTRKVSRPPAGQFSSTCGGLVAFGLLEGPLGPL